TRARLSFDERVIRYDDQLLAHVEIGIGTHVAVNSGPLRIEEVFQLVADPLADHKAHNCSIRAIDEHVVDYTEQSSALRDHLLTDDGRHARQIIDFSQFLYPRSTHRHRVRPDRIHSGSGNHPPLSPTADDGFTMHHHKPGQALTITLHNDFPDFPEPLRRF